MEKIQIFKHIQVPTFSKPLQLEYKGGFLQGMQELKITSKLQVNIL